jgi:hypothetical protein
LQKKKCDTELLDDIYYRDSVVEVEKKNEHIVGFGKLQIFAYLCSS